MLFLISRRRSAVEAFARFTPLNSVILLSMGRSVRDRCGVKLLHFKMANLVVAKYNNLTRAESPAPTILEKSCGLFER